MLGLGFRVRVCTDKINSCIQQTFMQTFFRVFVFMERRARLFNKNKAILWFRRAIMVYQCVWLRFFLILIYYIALNKLCLNISITFSAQPELCMNLSPNEQNFDNAYQLLS